MAPTASSFTTLGTAGGPMLHPQRSQPAHLLMHGDRPILIDCGEGAFRQLKRAGIEYRDVGEIFLTHHHFDHIGSLFACLGLNMMTMRKQPLTIYGPPGTQRIVDGLIAACEVPQAIGFGVPGQSLPAVADFITVREIVPGDVITLDGLTVSNCENTHYRPEAEAGLPGYLSLSLRFDMADRSIFFSGDTGPCKAIETLAKGVDLLVGEMMDAELTMRNIRRANPSMPDAAIAKIGKHIADHHLNPEQLGELGTVAGASELVATHLPPGLATPETAPDYVARIASRFSGKISIAEDLSSY
jgi:ribonuclease BN (tRNA processing enzyme)